ncbi:MAG: hypothetical protein SGPRY_014983, partial [Prymnesium sp.]
METRAAFDMCALQQLGPLGHVFTDGQPVITRNGRAEIKRLFADGGVEVTYKLGDSYATRKYSICRGNDKGSACLQHIPPSLCPASRVPSTRAISDVVKKEVLDHANMFCSVSPHQHDVKRRRIAPFVYEEKPAPILSDVHESMYTDFIRQHPSTQISFSGWKKVLKEVAGNITKAYRSTCLDRLDVNYKWHRESLQVVGKLLEQEHYQPHHEADNDDSCDPPDPHMWVCVGEAPPSDADGELLINEQLSRLLSIHTRLSKVEWARCGIAKLQMNHYVCVGDKYFVPSQSVEKQFIEFAAHTKMSVIANALVCSECLSDSTKLECLDGACSRCGFQRLWSEGLRPHIDGADPFWGQEISWDTIKPGDDTDASNVENDLRHHVSGTIIDFLEEFETVRRNWIPHRFHAMQVKAAERELEQNMTPHKIRKNTDWSENGEIIVKDQMQSEYWHTKYYSLLITISAFLITDSWIDREGALPAQAVVTVQPESVVPLDGAPPPLTYTDGSFYAVVQHGNKAIGEDIEYTVMANDGCSYLIPRHRLRQRVWYRCSFLGITNEKQHVALTTQAFHNEEMEFWKCWHEYGRDAAIAYAAADRAAFPPLVATVDTDSIASRFDATRAARQTAAAVAATANDPTSSPKCVPKCASDTSTRALRSSKPGLAVKLRKLDSERFTGLVAHSDNATHLKSSNNLYYWSKKMDELSIANFINKVMFEYGCPGKGKGPWDGVDAAVKKKMRNDIVNEIVRKMKTTPSGRAICALEVAQHLRTVLSSQKLIDDHKHMCINETIVFYIDKDEFRWPA